MDIFRFRRFPIYKDAWQFLKELKKLSYVFRFRAKGFTLIEVLIGTFLILIVFLGIFGVYQLGLKVVGMSKAKIIATAIANGEIEKIRNLPYQSVGTKDAQLPFAKGALDSVTSTVFNNMEFQIEKKVKFIVDEADGIGGADVCNWDYKRVEIKVSWIGRFKGEIKLVTDVAPKNKNEEIQSCQTQPGGILSVLVFDAFGVPVSSPLIEVFNPVSGVRVDFAVPSNGSHDFPLATSTYKVVVSKDGYSSERTFASGESYAGEIIAIPEKSNPIVLEGQTTSISFSIDKLSSMTVETRGLKELGYPIIHNVTFNLRGEKLVGYDDTEKPIYKYSQNHITNGSGSVSIPNLEWDSYYFSIVTPDLDLTEIESPLGVTTTQPIGLSPAGSKEVRLVLKAENSLLLTVKDATTSEPIFSASSTLFNGSLGYEKTQYTDENGQTYFIPLEAATYNLEVSGPGYNSTSTTILISGDTTTTIKLEQIE